MKRSNIAAYLMIMFKSMIYGSTVLFTGRLLMQTTVLDVLALRFLVSAAAFGAARAVGLIKINYKGKNLKPLLLAGIFEPLLWYAFETSGIKYTSTMMVGILEAMGPVFSVTLSMLLLRERTTRLQMLFVIIRILGCVIVVAGGAAGQEESSEIIGIVLILLATISGAMHVVFSKKSTREFSHIEVAYFMAFLGAIVFNTVNIVRHIFAGNITSYFEPFLNPGCIMGLIFLGVVSSIMATSMGVYAVSKLPVAVVSAWNGMSTITTILIGIFVNNELFMKYHAVGIILILGGSFAVSYIDTKVCKNKISPENAKRI